MIDYIKNGLSGIKETKQYAREKNTPNWLHSAVIGSVLTLYIFTSIFIFIIDYLDPILPTIPPLQANLITITPIILTFLFMMNYGKYPIKLMILEQFYLQKLVMKIINKIDMYYWKKHDKESVASNFIVKHRKLVQFMVFIPLMIYIILSW